MSSHTETELKLRFDDAEIWNTITEEPLLQRLAVPGSQKVEALETVYFDTPSLALKNRGIAYRIRHKSGEWVATVKAGGVSGGGLHERKEWSVAVNAPEPDITVFPEEMVGIDLHRITGPEILSELFRTSFERKIMLLKTPEGGEIEFCTDKGWIIAGHKRRPLREIEMELRGAAPAEALKLGAALARKYALLPEIYSKYYQGLELAGIQPREETEELEIERDRGENAGQTLSRALALYLQEVVGALNDFIATPREQETAHRVRVKLRRLRSAISLCRPLLPAKDYAEQSGKLRRFNHELDGLPHQEMKDVLGKAAGGRYTPLLLETWAWLLAEPWRKKRIKDLTLKDFVEKRLADLMKK